MFRIALLPGSFYLLTLFAVFCLNPHKASGQGSFAAALPEPPRARVETELPPGSGRIVAIRAGGNFQEALKAAQPGDVITLEAGATFTGPFVLPRKSGSGWIVIRTSAPEGKFPSPGKRVDPSYAPLMPKLVARSGPVITTEPGAHHYRFIGLEIRPQTDTFLNALVQLGADETSAADLPHHVIFDRCYLHGDAKKGTRRGIVLNGGETGVIDSYFSDFKEAGADSQAIAGWNGSGPFKIENNYLEGAGENVLFGGADPRIPNLVPSDIEIRRNTFFKPLSWKADDPGFAGTPWTIKNLLELKNARRVHVEGNLFEHNWIQAQNGFAILFTVRNQEGKAPWSVVEDVAFINNVVRHTASGVNILGRDDIHPSQETKRILIKNNLFEDVGGPQWGGGGRLIQLLDETADIVVDRNTAFQTGSIIMADGKRHERFVYTRNIAIHNGNGITGSGTGAGNPTLERYFPGAVVKKNVLVGGSAAHYPRDNFFPSSLDLVKFRNRAHGDYRLSASSPFKSAGVDGGTTGVDFSALCGSLGATANSFSSCPPQPSGKEE